MLLLSLLACTASTPPAPIAVAPGPTEPPITAIEAPLHVGEPAQRLVVDGAVWAAPGLPNGKPALHGDLATPGFVDAHGHLSGLGDSLATLDLVGIDTYAGTLAKVHAAAAGEGWLLGRGWDQNDWSDAPGGEGGWPMAKDLDLSVGDRPTVLTRIDGHAVWVNSAALAAAGITALTPDPPGGRILHLDDGTLRGILIDNAVDLIHVPQPSRDEHLRRLKLALDAVAAAGLTGVHDMSVDDESFSLLQELDQRGELRIRVWAYVKPESETAKILLATGPIVGKHLSAVGIKTYADGALGSRGAWLQAPYSDDPQNTGLPVSTPEQLADLATRCLGAKVQLAIHAIGDGGVHAALDAIETARKAYPDHTETKFRIEHAQVVDPADVPRFRALGVTASMQPTHATSDMPWAEARLGPERIRWAYAWRTLLDGGAPVIFGSDFPVEAVDPGLGVWAATTRTDVQGLPADGWYPEQRLTLDEAIAAFTRGPAIAVGAPGGLGMIAQGGAADLTLWRLGGDGRYKAIATMVDGTVIWEAAQE